MPDTAAVGAPLEMQAVQDLIDTIQIPPRPDLLCNLQKEMEKDDPNLRAMSRMIAKDAALCGALLKSANSAFARLPRKAETVEEAITGLGLQLVSMLVAGFLLRGAFPDSPEFTAFWDTSAKQASAASHIAKALHYDSGETAHVFGLFCDIGMPLMAKRFTDYTETLRLAGQAAEISFTRFEEQRHQTSHTVAGALLARNWMLPRDVIMAIRLHHDPSVFKLTQASAEVRHLIALEIIADLIIEEYRARQPSTELQAMRPAAMQELGLSAGELNDLSVEIHSLFEQEE